MSAGAPTIGGLKRLSLYMAGQLASNVTITGGSVTGVTLGSSAATITGGTITGVTLGSSAATLTGGTIDGMAIGGTTPASGAFTSVSSSVEDGSTAANFANFGLTKFGDETTVATTYTLTAPSRAGLLKMLASEQSDTLIKTVTASGASFNDSTTLTKLTFDTNAESVMLMAESTAIWRVISNVGSVGLSS